MKTMSSKGGCCNKGKKKSDSPEYATRQNTNLGGYSETVVPKKIPIICNNAGTRDARMRNH